MSDGITGQEIRRVLLEIIDEFSKIGPGYFQTGAILNEASQRLKIRNNLANEQALLTLYYDLFRSGQLSWGYNLPNTDPPFCHLTEQGRLTLRHLSRDPANPDGYLAHLNTQSSLNPIAESYVREALNTYTSNCFKATAVMIGAAAESIVLELRDILIAQMTSLGRTPPRNLQDWRVKRVIDSLKGELELQKGNMPPSLYEAFEAYWPAFTQQIRTARNEAGHPTSVEPVTPETVHASLLIFPELARLGSELKSWVSRHYT